MAARFICKETFTLCTSIAIKQAFNGGIMTKEAKPSTAVHSGSTREFGARILSKESLQGTIFDSESLPASLKEDLLRGRVKIQRTGLSSFIPGAIIANLPGEHPVSFHISARTATCDSLNAFFGSVECVSVTRNASNSSLEIEVKDKKQIPALDSLIKEINQLRAEKSRQ